MDMESRMAKLETQTFNIEKKLDEHIKDQKSDFGRLEGKVDSVITSVACLNDKYVLKDEYSKKMGTLDSAIENLKKFRWQIIAGGTAVIYILEKLGILK